MILRLHRLPALSGLLLLFAGCATVPSDESSASAPDTGERTESAGSSRESAPTPLTATEAAVAARRSSASSSGPSDTAKLVEQLNEAARELATLRTANAKLRTERERPPPPVAAPAAKADPADERLAASLKSYAAFKQEMASLLSEIERSRKGSAELGADLKAATEQVRQARAALARAEDDVRVEKRLRLEAEANAGQLREQLRTIARAMADAGLSAEKLTATAGSDGSRGRTASRPPSRYVVREGDTLKKIADRLYGDENKWRAILDANRGRVRSDSTVAPGTELEIPRN
jgi:nucleoid-associated protein YgaU